MKCIKCDKDAAAEALFCRWCDSYLPDQASWLKADIFSRAVALVIDPMIAMFLWFAATFIFGGIMGGGVGVAVAFLFPLAYGVWGLTLLVEGQTPGKKLMGLRVVNEQDGKLPGFGRMFVREIPGRIVSGLICGLGYLWAVFDKDGQCWHDKIARTVVVRPAEPAAKVEDHSSTLPTPPVFDSK